MERFHRLKGYESAKRKDQQSINKMIGKKPTPKHNIVKFQNTKYKRDDWETE